MRCKNCGKQTRLADLKGDVCGQCLTTEGEFVKEEEHIKILITTETNPDLKIEERINIITSECVIGLNIFKDFFSGIRDVIGGRNKGFQNALKNAKDIVLQDLRKQAFETGANAVIAVDLKYSEISGGGKSMLFVVATGTSVKIAE